MFVNSIRFDSFAGETVPTVSYDSACDQMRESVCVSGSSDGGREGWDVVGW